MPGACSRMLLPRGSPPGPVPLLPLPQASDKWQRNSSDACWAQGPGLVEGRRALGDLTPELVTVGLV